MSVSNSAAIVVSPLMDEAAAQSASILGAGVLNAVMAVASKATPEIVLVSGRYKKPDTGAADNTGVFRICSDADAVSKAMCSARPGAHNSELSRARNMLAAAIYAPRAVGALAVAAMGSPCGLPNVDAFVSTGNESPANLARQTASKVGGAILRDIDAKLEEHVKAAGSVVGFKVDPVASEEFATATIAEHIAGRAERYTTAAPTAEGEEVDTAASADAARDKMDEGLKKYIRRYIKDSALNENRLPLALNALASIGCGPESWLFTSIAAAPAPAPTPKPATNGAATPKRGAKVTAPVATAPAPVASDPTALDPANAQTHAAPIAPAPAPASKLVKGKRGAAAPSAPKAPALK